jgi:hypothetical protein
MSPAPTSEQVARARESGQGIPGRVGTTGAVGRVEPPSGRWQTYQPNNYMRISVPGNWQQLSGGGTITYAPEGGYLQTNQGETAFTHGVQVGNTRSETGNLGEDSQLLIQAFARSNPQLRQESRFRRDNIGGRSGLTTTLSNVSDVTGEREIITLSTVPLDGENLLFLIGVAPQSESRIYQQAFSRVRQSMQLAQ